MTTPTPASTPRWLTAYTTTTGLPDPRHTGTTARPRHCATCRRLVLAGYDAPLIAELAVVDPHPLTAQLETAAVLLDIPTWRLWGRPGSYELTPRHRPRVPRIGNAPSADECTVLAAHRCGMPPLSRADIPTPETARPRPTDPPF